MVQLNQTITHSEAPRTLVQLLEIIMPAPTLSPVRLRLYLVLNVKYFPLIFNHSKPYT